MSLNRSAPSSAGGSGSTPLARRVRLARRWLPRAAIAAAVLLATAGCQSNAFTRMGMPAPITKQAKVVVTMWQGSWIAAWAAGCCGTHGGGPETMSALTHGDARVSLS